MTLAWSLNSELLYPLWGCLSTLPRPCRALPQASPVSPSLREGGPAWDVGVGVEGLGCVSDVSDPGERCPQVLGDVTWAGRRPGSSFSLEPGTGCSLADHLMLAPWDLCWPPGPPE